MVRNSVGSGTPERVAGSSPVLSVRRQSELAEELVSKTSTP